MSVIEELAGGGGDVGGKQKQVGLRADYDIQPGGEIRSLGELEERERRYMRALKEAQQDDGRRLVYAKRDGDDTRPRTEQKRARDPNALWPARAGVSTRARDPNALSPARA